MRHFLFLAILASAGLLSADRCCPPPQPSAPMFVVTWTDANNNIKTVQSRNLTQSNWTNSQTVGPANSSEGPVIANGKHYWKIVWLDGNYVMTANANHNVSGSLAWSQPARIKDGGVEISSNIRPTLAFDEKNDNWLFVFQTPAGFRVGRLNPAGRDLLNVQAANFSGVTPQPEIGSEISVDYYADKFHLAFESTIGERTGVWYSSSVDGITWSNPVLVRQGGYGQPIIRNYLYTTYIASIESAGSGATGLRAEIHYSTNGVNWLREGNTYTGSIFPSGAGIGMDIGGSSGTGGGGLCKLLITAPISGASLQSLESFDGSLCDSNPVNLTTVSLPSNVQMKLGISPSVAYGDDLPPNP